MSGHWDDGGEAMPAKLVAITLGDSPIWVLYARGGVAELLSFHGLERSEQRGNPPFSPPCPPPRSHLGRTKVFSVNRLLPQEVVMERNIPIGPPHLLMPHMPRGSEQKIPKGKLLALGML